MDKSDYKQLVTEIKNVSRRKEFKGFIKGFKSIEDIKDAYDYIIINVCKKYKLDTNIIVENMEEMWSNAKYSDFEKEAKKLLPFYGKDIDAVGADLIEAILFPRLHSIHSAVPLVQVGKIPLDKILAMNKYMNDLEEYIVSIAKKELEKNG